MQSADGSEYEADISKKIITLTHIVNNQNILSVNNYWNILSMVVE